MARAEAPGGQVDDAGLAELAGGREFRDGGVRVVQDEVVLKGEQVPAQEPQVFRGDLGVVGHRLARRPVQDSGVAQQVFVHGGRAERGGVDGSENGFDHAVSHATSVMRSPERCLGRRVRRFRAGRRGGDPVCGTGSCGRFLVRRPSAFPFRTGRDRRGPAGRMLSWVRRGGQRGGSGRRGSLRGWAPRTPATAVPPPVRRVRRVGGSGWRAARRRGLPGWIRRRSR